MMTIAAIQYKYHKNNSFDIDKNENKPAMDILLSSNVCQKWFECKCLSNVGLKPHI